MMATNARQIAFLGEDMLSISAPAGRCYGWQGRKSHEINDFLGHGAIFTVSLGAISTAASAQADYPTRPIKLIVPFTAGGGVDTVARIVGEELKGVLGQSIVVENLPGASGMRGAETAVRAEPDGYTLLLSSAGEAAVNPHLFKNIKYDPSRDLTPSPWWSRFRMSLWSTPPRA
jgi:tripartite-type tricarboxylate transporter receptor subunit TctC